MNGGLVAGIPFSAIVTQLGRLVGPAATWLPLLVFFPIATTAISRLVGGRQIARLAAATIYTVNPFVFERIGAGHIALLLAYALLPFAVTSALRSPSAAGWARATPALWWAALTALSPHYAWIYGVVIVAVLAVVRPLSRTFASVAAAVVAFVALSLYILLPSFAGSSPTAVGASDLALFRTRGDPHLGLFGNVLGLYGFWREHRSIEYHWLPKYVVSGWPIFLAAILVVAGYGAVRALRSEDPLRRRIGWVVLLGGVAGYFLALGDQGPTGPLFRLVYDHLPFFSIMREPEKFLVLACLAYALFFGWGIEAIFPAIGVEDHTRTSGRRMTARATVIGATAFALPLAYCPTLFDGLAGQIASSRLPVSWSRADALMGGGTGKILFLPWHLYMSLPFAGDRDVANPAPTSFRRTVISGDDIEAGKLYTESTSKQSAYIEGLLANGPGTDDFGSVIAPLGVRYIMLYHNVDWSRYSWLDHQGDLRLVLARRDLQVWENTRYAGIAVRSGSSGSHSPAARVRRISPVAYRLPAGLDGAVALAEPYQSGWSLEGRPALPSPWGTLEVSSSGRAGVVSFGPWTLVRWGYGLSLACTFVLAGSTFRERIRRSRPTEAKGWPQSVENPVRPG